MLKLSKNTFSFTPDAKCINRHLTVVTEQVIGAGSTHTILTLPLTPADDIYHASISVACSFPGEVIAAMPTLSATCTSGAPMGVETINAITTAARTGFIRGVVVVSSTTAYTEIQVNLTAGPYNFTIPAGSVIAVSIEPNEALLSTEPMPSPPPVVAAITYGFTVPVDSGIPTEIQGDYRRFPYSFDKTGTAVSHHNVGVYERSVDDGTTITVYAVALFLETGWDMWSMFKRVYTDYAAAKAVHFSGAGFEDYSAGFNFTSDPDWVQHMAEAMRAYGSYADGSGYRPGLMQLGNIPLSTIQP